MTKYSIIKKTSFQEIVADLNNTISILKGRITALTEDKKLAPPSQPDDIRELKNSFISTKTLLSQNICAIESNIMDTKQ